jgi:hypothetical protein
MEKSLGGVNTRDFFSPPGVLGGSTNSSAITFRVSSPDKKNSARVAYVFASFCALILYERKVRIMVVRNEELLLGHSLPQTNNKIIRNKYPHSTAFQSHDPVAATARNQNSKGSRKTNSHLFNTETFHGAFNVPSINCRSGIAILLRVEPTLERKLLNTTSTSTISNPNNLLNLSSP